MRLTEWTDSALQAWRPPRTIDLVKLLLLGLLMLPAPGYGEMRSYVDEQGATVFVDDQYLSPAERRDLEKKVRASEQALHQSLITPVEVRGNQVLVPVAIGDGRRDIRARLLLDTGASQTVFHRQAVAELQTLPVAKGWSQIAGGQVIATDKVRLDYLQVGPHTWKRPAVYLIDHSGRSAPFDGLLGMDFLRDHPYRIDFREQRIHWQPAD